VLTNPVKLAIKLTPVPVGLFPNKK